MMMRNRQDQRILKLYLFCSLILGVIIVFNRTLSVHHIFYKSNISINTWNIDYLQSWNMTSTRHYTVGVTPESENNWRKNGMLYEIPAYNVSILSAIGRNRSSNSGWTSIILNGWEGRTYLNHNFDCCVYYQTGEMAQVPVKNKNHWTQCKLLIDYIATQYTCRNPGKLNGSNPVGISLVSSNKSCNIANKNYMDIYYPQKKANDSIGLCAKIAYGSVSTKKLIEWYEIQRQFGVNKVVTFKYNLTGSALDVLEYYRDEGFVDLLPYQYPHKDAPVRNVGEKSAQVYNDEQVVGYDCAERLAGYQYVGLLDHDEFLVPTPPKIKKWIDIFKIILRRKPNTSGFMFRTELFVTDWGKVDNSSTFFVTQFLNRTRPMWDRQKNIYMPERVLSGTVWTHNFTSMNNYETYHVSSALAVVKHYRSCRREWIERNNCFTRRRYEDRRMTDIVETVNSSIQSLQQHFVTKG